MDAEGARAIVDENSYMTLATAAVDGAPWASPVWFAHEQYTAAGVVHWPALLHYDYVVVRADDAESLPFHAVPPGVAPRLRRGMWWVFETPRARALQRSCNPLSGT